MHSEARRCFVFTLAAFAIAGESARGHDGLESMCVFDAPAPSNSAQLSIGPYFPLTAVPQLSSRPSAHAKIYLDFNGDTTDTWLTVSPGTTPAYDIDSNPNSFSQTELDNMTEIYKRVSEKF